MVYCGQISMIGGGSLIFIIIIEMFVGKSPLHLSLKGGFGTNHNTDFKAVSLFNDIIFNRFSILRVWALYIMKRTLEDYGHGWSFDLHNLALG